MNLKVVSLNVRNSTPTNPENQTDPIRELIHGNFRRRSAWRHRRDHLAKTLLDTESDIIGLQEVLSDQFDFLSSSLMSQYDLVGVGRDDGKRKGEFAPIAFRKDKFECIEWNTFWLSETVDVVGSKYPGACCVRICTWARLRVRDGGAEDGHDSPQILVANAHLDHKSESARTFGCKVIDDTVRKIMKAKEAVIVLGDFNFQTQGEEGYRMLLNESQNQCLEPRWRDSYTDIAAKTMSPSDIERYGVTFHDFGRSSGLRIDFIFYLPQNGSTKIQTIDSYVTKDGEDGVACFVSDHYVLTSKFLIACE